MWRFLHNIPRALKNYHGPRASVGVYVETDDKEQDPNVKTESQACVLPGHATSQPKREIDLTVLLRLPDQRNQRRLTHHQQEDQDEENKTNQEEEQNWWHSSHRDVRAFLEGSNRMLDAFIVGSSTLWGYNNKKKKKSDLLYRVLFSIHDESGIFKTIKTQEASSLSTLQPWPQQNQLAIKDAEGSAHDREINRLKSETLAAALKGFEDMCYDYKAQNESLLAHEAADRGEMTEAVNHFHTSCAMGNKTACFNLGLFYETGKGVTKDLDKAKHYYRLAAAKGHSHAMYNLALMYLDEEERDLCEGIHFMEAAARAGLLQAQIHMGIYHIEETGNAGRAAAFFKAAANQNDSEAQYYLALCHEFGHGLEVNECKAAQLYSSAANMGHVGAMFNLGEFIENGLGGIPSDPSTAMQLYTKAADLGNEDAKNRIEELKTMAVNKRTEHHVHNLQEDKTQAIAQQSYKTPLTPKSTLHSSMSSPNLKLSEYSLPDILIPRAPAQLTSLQSRRAMFDSRKGVCLSKVETIEKICDSMIPDKELSQLEAMQRDSCKMCYPIHKSKTTSDLSSLVACNI